MTSAIRATAAAAVLLADIAIGAPAQAAGPDPSKVYIESIGYGGTGCPQGTVGQSISNDRMVATLIFDSFVASSGPDVSVTEGRKNCQININLHAPRSHAWLATVTPTERGYEQLTAGAAVTRTRTIYAQTPILPKRPQKKQVMGPIAADYVSTTTYHQGDAALRCMDESVRPDNVNEEVAIRPDAPAVPGQTTIDSFDIKIANIATLPCRN